MSDKTVIRVSCTDQVLKIVEAPIIASGGLNEIKVEFDFCNKWDGFAKTAVFYQDETEPYFALVGEDDTCVVPWEVCYSDGTFYFSVFGDKDDVRRTSVTIRYKVKKGAIRESLICSDPTPEIYDQLLAELARIRSGQETFITQANKALDDAKEECKTFAETAENILNDAKQLSIEAVRYVAQELTEQQQAQARENIGALCENDIAEIKKDIADIKYKPITITKFTNNAGTIEVGTTLYSVLLNWETSKAPVKLRLDGVEIDKDMTSKEIAGVFNDGFTWTLEAEDERGAVAKKTTSMGVANRVYWGAKAEGTVDSNFVNGLSHYVLADKVQREFNITADGNKHIWYCVPKRLGKCTFFVGGFEGGFSLVGTVDVMNGSLFTEPYYIYKSDNAGLGTTTVEVKSSGN